VHIPAFPVAGDGITSGGGSKANALLEKAFFLQELQPEIA